jgi:hypothetical protein
MRMKPPEDGHQSLVMTGSLERFRFYVSQMQTRAQRQLASRARSAAPGAAPKNVAQK